MYSIEVKFHVEGGRYKYTSIKIIILTDITCLLRVRNTRELHQNVCI